MPQVDFQITYQEQSELLVARDIDIGLTFEFSIRYAKELEYRKISTSEFCLAIPETHSLAEEPVITKDMLRNQTMIVLKDESQPSFFNSIFDVGNIMNNQYVRMAQNIYSMLLYVDMGVGIGILPRFVADHVKGYKMVERGLADVDTREDVVITWNTENQNPAVTEFIVNFMEDIL